MKRTKAEVKIDALERALHATEHEEARYRRAYSLLAEEEERSGQELLGRMNSLRSFMRKVER
jgi:hypothetical protein